MVSIVPEKENKILVKGDDLKSIHIYSYGVGHFMNDLCASCWFFFLSYYLKDIIKIGEYNAGYVILAGQIADALATPLVGILSDKTDTRIGKRTPWYIAGTFLVLVAFTLIFVKVIPLDCTETTILIYYISCASLFNIGWAAVQVSHMALLPIISLNKKNKDMMNRVRTGFTFLAQTLALCFSFIYFYIIPDKIVQYEILAVSCVIFGFFTSVIFLFLCREMTLAKNIPFYLEVMRTSLINHVKFSEKQTLMGNDQEHENIKINQIESNSIPFDPKSQTNINLSNQYSAQDEITWTYWMKKPDFYVCMMVYMFVRLSINVTQSVIPFYMEYVLKFAKSEDGGTPVEISIVLIISTLGSILNSTILQSLIERKIKNTRKNRLVMISSASLFVILGCVPMFFLNSEWRYPIYILSFLFGIGFSQGLSTVSNLINDVVGSKGAQGAFVYGAYSFSDKLSCGIVLAFFIPIADNETVLKYSLPIFPPLSLIIAFIIVYFRGYCKDRDEEKLSKLYEEDDKDINKNNKKSFLDDSRFTFITHTNDQNRDDHKFLRDNISSKSSIK